MATDAEHGEHAGDQPPIPAPPAPAPPEPPAATTARQLATGQPDVSPSPDPATLDEPPAPPAGYGPPGYAPYASGPPGYAPYATGPSGYGPPGYGPPSHAPYATGPSGYGPPGRGSGDLRTDAPVSAPPYGYAPAWPAAGGWGPPPGWVPPPWTGHGDAWYWAGRPTRSARSRRIAAVAAGVVLLAFGAGIGIGDAIAPTSPAAAHQQALQQAAAAYTQALASARHAGSFHYIERSGGSGQAETITGDAGADGGSQAIVLGDQRYRLILVGSDVYFAGNAASMKGQLGAPDAVARSDAGRWISVPASTGDMYQLFEQGITADSNLDQFGSSGILFTAASLGSAGGGGTVIHGAIGGGQPSSSNRAALTVRGSQQLPASFTAQASSRGQTTTIDWVFSRWGEKVSTATPGGVIPYGVLGATPPTQSGGSSGGAAPGPGGPLSPG